jgi:hypothetical protein
LNWSINNAAIIGLSRYIKQGKDRVTTLVQEYGARKSKYSLQKEAHLIKQKCVTQETAAQTIKNQLKSSIENENIEELKSKQVHEQFYWDLERPPVDKKIPWHCYVAQA